MTKQNAVCQLVVDGLTELLRSPAAKKLDLTRYSWPLPPYVGPLYETAPVRIVIVGKAPGGWGQTKESSLADFGEPTDELWERNAQLVRQFVDSVTAHYAGRRGYHSSFWHRTYSICASLLEHREQLDSTREPGRSERTFNSIAWTNVFKIGTRGGNPDGPLADLLQNHGPHLSEELDLLRPQVVVFSTGHSYDVYLRKAGLTVSLASTNLAVVDVASTLLAVRAPHFQAQSNNDLAKLYQRLRAHRLSTG